MSIVLQALMFVSVGALAASIAAMCFAMIVTIRSEVKHDKTKEKGERYDKD